MKWIWMIADKLRDWVGAMAAVAPTRLRILIFDPIDGICDGCGGTLLRIEENGIELCKGCGEVHCIQRQGNGDENPAKTVTTP